MPSSFSRFLDEDNLTNLRDQYLAALSALEAEEEAMNAPADPQRDDQGGPDDLTSSRDYG